MKDLQIFSTQDEFNVKYPNGVPSKVVSFVEETGEVSFSTNNFGNKEFEQVRAYVGGSQDLSNYLTKEEYELDSSAFITSNDVSQFTTSDDISVFLTSVDTSKMAVLDGKNFGNLMVGDNSSTHSYYIGARKSFNNEESISQFLNDGYKTNISNRVGSTVNSRIILDKDGATIQCSGDNHTVYTNGNLERIATREWVELDVSLKLESNDVSQFCTLSDVQSEGYLKDNDVSIYVTESQLSNEVSTFITDNDVSLLITEDDLNYETWIFTLSDDSSISKNIVIK